MKRVVLSILGTVVLAGICWLCWLRSTGVGPRAGQADRASAESQARALAEQGRPIVAAIYEFKKRCGLWPSRLEELVPPYLSEEAVKEFSYLVRNWRYTWKPSGWWYLTNYFDFPQWAVRYEHRKDFEGWQLTDGEYGVDLGVEQPKVSSTVVTEEELLWNMQSVMSNRIKAEPKMLVHYKGQISWHYRRQQLAEAKAVCLRCQEVWPGHWWPNLMISMLDARLESFPAAEQRLINFTDKKADFNHAFFLAYFYVVTGETDKGFATLKKAANLPLADVDSDWQNTGEHLGVMALFYPWQASLMAYGAKRYDVVLAICDRWERYHKEESSAADRSYYTIRAACYLNLGQIDKAEAQIRGASEVAKDRRFLADNIDDLSTAIKRRDMGFVYEPRKNHSPFTPLIEYE